MSLPATSWSASAWLKKTDCLDCRRPYPAGVEDAEDVAAWAASHPSTLPPLELSRLTLSGFSAGGNIALVLSLKLGPERCSAVSVLYPPTEMHLPTENVQEVWRTPPNPNFKYGVRLPRPVNIFFRQAYIVEGTDDNVPWISPLNAEADQFPKVRVENNSYLSTTLLTS